MRLNYSTIGEYIRLVNIKNEDGEVDLLLGVNLNKKFMPSVANIVGTDLTKYKIIKKGQFGCKLMSVGRDKKLPISLLTEHNEAIISTAYFVFEIIDETELLPDYLMMWFRRAESDRYLWFQSGGDIRGRITWDDLCSLPIKVPSIEKQREIVKEYNTVVNRIKLNETLNQKLEETAQALYKHWFVDFEFPNKDGKPYKSSGGKLVFNEELDKDIPEGWEAGNIGELVKNIGGGTPKTEIFDYWNNGDVNWFSPTDITKSSSIFCSTSNKKITELGLNNSSAKLFPKHSVMMTSRATIGEIGINTEVASTNQGFITLIPNKMYPLYFLVEWLKTNLDEIDQLSSGSTFKEINKSDFRCLKIIKSTPLVSEIEKLLIPFYSQIETTSALSEKLVEFRSVLLSKMTMVEVEKEMA